MIAFEVRHYDSVGSTNDEALRLAQAGAPHGTVVCAREQIAGRGRQGRTWHSPPGNLYVSILLRPSVPPDRAATLSFVAALAVADTVDAFLPEGVRATLKWPNDVLVAGAKISGILLEYADDAVVIGMGVNIEHAPTGTPYRVTSVREMCGWSLTPTLSRAAGEGAQTAPSPAARERVGVRDQQALSTLLAAFASHYAAWQATGFAATRAAWLARAHPPRTQLRVSLGTTIIPGAFLDLGPDGALVIETQTGIRRIVAGEVSA